MSFATIADLKARIGDPLPVPDPQAQAALDDATAYLQGELGQLVTAGTATFTTRLAAGEHGPTLYLPQMPVRAVTTVEVDGTPTTAYDFVDQRIAFRTGWWRSLETTFPDADNRAAYRDVTVTFDYGYLVVPAELVTWTCILAGQIIAGIVRNGGIGAGGIERVERSIDDYRIATTYANPDASPLDLPAEALDRLRSRYGAGAYVTTA